MDIIKNSKIILKKHKQLITSISLFFLIFYLLGLQFPNIWPWEFDDFHSIYNFGYKTQNWNWCKIFYYFFNNGDSNQSVNVANYIRPKFFGALYRPFYCIYFALMYRLFRLSQYYYLLGGIIFHSINSVILFYVARYFINYLPAILVALLFAFHPIVAWDFGNTYTFQFTMPTAFALFSFIFIKKYLDTKKFYFYVLACISFIISLFIREIFLPFPIIMFFGIYLYKNQYKNLSLKTFFQQFFKTLKTCSLFIMIVLSFLGLRAYLYSIDLTHFKNTKNITLLASIKNNLFSIYTFFKVFLYDFFGLSWISWDIAYKLIRIGLFAFSLLILLLLFIKNKRKIYITYLLGSTILMLWPIPFLKRQSHHYWYESYFFLFLAIVLLFHFYKGNFKKLKIIGFFILLSITGTFTTLTIKSLIEREYIMHTCSSAIKNLAKNPKIKNKDLYFFGLPGEYFTLRVENIFKILLNESNKIFIDYTTMTQLTQPYIDLMPAWKKVLTKYSAKKIFSANCVKIKPIKNGFQLQSLNPQKIFFKANKNNKSLGKKIINKTIKLKEKILTTDFNLLIKRKYRTKNSVFITWDYKNADFKILNE